MNKRNRLSEQEIKKVELDALLYIRKICQYKYLFRQKLLLIRHFCDYLKYIIPRYHQNSSLNPLVYFLSDLKLMFLCP